MTTPANRSLGKARSAKQDEFYTQYVDIQKEIEAYVEFDPDTFRGKVVYYNCDDPFGDCLITISCETERRGTARAAAVCAQPHQFSGCPVEDNFAVQQALAW